MRIEFSTLTNVIQEKRFDRIKIYRFRLEDPKIRAIKTLFEIWENSEG